MKMIVAAMSVLMVCLSFLAGCDDVREPTDISSDNMENIPAEHFEAMVPYDAQLEIICANGKLVFSRIATTPRVRVSRPPFDETCTHTFENKHEIISKLFKVLDGKEATEERVSPTTLQLLLYGQRDDEPWHYLFEFGTDCLVRVSNNGKLICCVQISEEELQSIIQVCS